MPISYLELGCSTTVFSVSTITRHNTSTVRNCRHPVTATVACRALWPATGRLNGKTPTCCNVPLHTFNLAGYRSAHTAGTANRYWYGGLTDASWPLLRWNEEASEGFWPWLPF